MLETATKYILDLFTENEELKKFPKEFVNESIKWVKSWFLRPQDPKNTAKLEDPNKSIEVKKDIIQDKLDDLKDNTQFQKELTECLAAFEKQRARLKNVLTDSFIDVKGSDHIGDKEQERTPFQTASNAIEPFGFLYFAMICFRKIKQIKLGDYGNKFTICLIL